MPRSDSARKRGLNDEASSPHGSTDRSRRQRLAERPPTPHPRPAPEADKASLPAGPTPEELAAWTDTMCSICLETPHNAVLLVCKSHANGCRPYMCDTSSRHANCLDQYCKQHSGRPRAADPAGASPPSAGRRVERGFAAARAASAGVPVFGANGWERRRLGFGEPQPGQPLITNFGGPFTRQAAQRTAARARRAAAIAADPDGLPLPARQGMPQVGHEGGRPNPGRPPPLAVDTGNEATSPPPQERRPLGSRILAHVAEAGGVWAEEQGARAAAADGAGGSAGGAALSSSGDNFQEERDKGSSAGAAALALLSEGLAGRVPDGEAFPCPLCRQAVVGWRVMAPARKFFDAKKRDCSHEGCDFAGSYEELRKHARAEHPRVRPADVDPRRAHEWRRLERQSELNDVMSSIRAQMPGATIMGDYVIGGEWSDDEEDDDNDDGEAIEDRYPGVTMRHGRIVNPDAGYGDEEDEEEEEEDELPGGGGERALGGGMGRGFDFPGDDGSWWTVMLLFHAFGPNPVGSALRGGGVGLGGARRGLAASRLWERRSPPLFARASSPLPPRGPGAEAAAVREREVEARARREERLGGPLWGNLSPPRHRGPSVVDGGEERIGRGIGRREGDGGAAEREEQRRRAAEASILVRRTLRRRYQERGRFPAGDRPF